MAVPPELLPKWMEARTTHGAYLGGKELPEHYVWRSMLNRCNNPKDKSWPRYGGRGIGVCSKWRSYEAFLADMGPRPSPTHSIERGNVDGNYEPRNCSWATQAQQAQNKAGTRYYFNGYGVYTLTEAAQLVGISKALACFRFKSWGTFAKEQTWQELRNQM